MKEPKFSTMTLYTTALCNLNCTYCYICKDKEGGLKAIDDDIKRAFQEGEQIKTTLEYDPTIRDSLTEISLWGGEPFLGIYRFIDHIDEFFDAFPNIWRIDVSTNLSLPDHFQRIQDLVDAVDRVYHGKIRFDLGIQISIDGYEEMNDFSRGKGTTQKIINNWHKICDNLKYNDEKFFIHFFTKPTFSRSTYHFVDTPEKAYKWAEFYDRQLARYHWDSKTKVQYSNSLWNNAEPSEYTQEDGFIYANVSKSFASIDPKVRENLPSWSNFPSMVPEAALSLQHLEQHNFSKKELYDFFKCNKCGGGCGVYTYNMVPLHNNLYTMCHRGLFDSYVDYSSHLKTQKNLNDLATLWSESDAKYWIFDKENYQVINNMMKKLYCHPHKVFYVDCLQQIKAYADAGLVDEKYQDINNIIPTLGYFLCNAMCIQDGYMFSGSWVTHSPSEIPLFYNGTMDVAIQEIDRVVKERGIILE